MDVFKILSLVLYVGIIVVIAVIGRRQTRSSKDLLFGGGKIGAIMSAFSYGTAYFSAVLFIGFAGQIGWNFGLSSLWIAILNAIIGVFGVWAIIGWRMKKASIDLNVFTLGEYLEKRYKSPGIRIIATVATFLFLIPYSAAVFMGLSYLFTINFSLPYWLALLLIGLLTAFYLVMGGYKSVAMIDVVFGMIMIIGVVILFLTTLSKTGGLSTIIADLGEINPALVEVVGPPGIWPLFTLIFLTSVAPFAMPQLLQKFVSIKDKKAIKKGAIASSLFALLIGCIAYFVGATTRILVTLEDFPDVFINGTPIYDRLMPELLGHVVPEFLSSLMLLLILAASMSSLASMVLTSSSTFVKDIYEVNAKETPSDSKISRISQMANIIFVALSILLALGNFDSIVAIMGISWGALGSVFLGPVIWGLYGNPTYFSKKGAIFAGIVGLVVCITLFALGRPSPEAGTIGMLISLFFPLGFALNSKISTGEKQTETR